MRVAPFLSGLCVVPSLAVPASAQRPQQAADPQVPSPKPRRAIGSRTGRRRRSSLDLSAGGGQIGRS